LLIDIYI